MKIELVNPLENAPETILGYRRDGRPIYPIAGADGRVEVDTDDDDDNSDDDDEQDEDEDAKDEWVPPTKDEFEKVLAAKAKADSEAAARKRFLRDAGFDPKTGKAVAKHEVKLDLGFDEDDGDEEDVKPKAEVKDTSKFDPKRAMREAQRQLERQVLDVETRERDRALVLISAVPKALAESDLNPKYLDRALKHIDLNAVEVDSDREIDGLYDQIDELKKDFPEFFKRTRMREAAKEVADTKTVGGGKKTVAASDENLDFATRLRMQLDRGRG